MPPEILGCEKRVGEKVVEDESIMPVSFNSYKLSASALTRLFSALGLKPEKQSLTLFAVRGALPVSGIKGWTLSVALRPARVDYTHMRCTLGIWDHAAGKIFAAPGSTVPYIDYVKAAAQKGGKGANQLEPGYYTDLVKGEHLQEKPRGHMALRQSEARFIRRTAHGAPYKITDPLFFSNPHDNLHCSWNPDPEKPWFSSSGCLVVAGEPFCKRLPEFPENRGHWKVFHDMIYGARQKKFSLLLVTAEQVRSALIGEVPCLCYGSEGDAVKALQAGLRKAGCYKGPLSGVLDVRTYRAWNAAGFPEPRVSG